MPSTPYAQYIFIGKDSSTYAIEYFGAPGDAAATNFVTATQNSSLITPIDLAADLPAGLMYVISPSHYGDGSQSGKIILIDTGSPTTAGTVAYQDSDAGHGAGLHFNGVYAIEIDTTNHYLYAATQTYNTGLTTFGADTGIIRFTYDVSTGALSNQSNVYLHPGEGPAATTNWIQSMSLDAANGKLFYVDNSLGRAVTASTFPTPSNEVAVVDLSNNTATVLAKFNGGDDYLDASYNNGGIRSVAADPTDHLVFFSSNGGTTTPNAAQNNLWVVDDHTASQTAVKLTESATYDGKAPYEITFDDVNNFLYVNYLNNDGSGGGTLVRYAVSGNTTATVSLSGATVIAVTGSGSSPESSGIVDQLPVLTLSGSSATAINGGTAITLASGTPTITDSDGTHLASATVQITGGTFAGSTTTDHLTISGSASGTSGAISWSYDSANERLTLSGYDTLDNYETLLALVKYNATGDATSSGTHNSRTVTWTVSDGALGNPAGTNSTTTTFNVSSNTPPVAAAVGPFTIPEDQTSPRIAVTLSATDPDSGDAVLNFTIASLPAHGRLFTSSVAGTQLAVNSTVTATGTGPYTATIWFELVNPTDNDFNGNTTFTYTAFDGDTDSSAATVTVAVTSINDAPTAVNSSATFNEDTTHTFTAAEFQFTDTHDSPADGLGAVIITSLPLNGQLKFNGTTLVSGDLPDSISKTDIDAGKLTFVPAGNANGTSYASFGFKIQDDGGTTGTGAADTSTNTATFTLNVNSVSDAPSGANHTVTTPGAALYTFQVADFTVNDPNDSPADTLNRVQVTGLPSFGTLKDGATTLNVGDFVSLADIQNGLFKFDPGAGTGTATFQFKVEDTGSTNNGGVILAAASNTMSIAVDELPTIANLDGDSTTFVERGTPILLDQPTAALVADTDSTDFNGGNLTVAIATGGTAAEDVLSIVDGGGITVSSNAVSYNGNIIGTVAGGTSGAPLVVTFTTTDATAAAASALVHQIAYQNTNLTDPDGTDRVVRFTVNDGDGATSANNDVTVHVTPINDEPTLSATGTSPTFTEGDAPTLLFSGAAASTIEANQTFASLTLTVTNVTDGASEILAIDGSNVALTAHSVVTAHGTVTVTLASGTATVTLSGASLTASDLQTLIDGLAYSNTSQDPTAANRVVTVTQVVDSGLNTPAPNDSTADLTGVTSTVTVVAVNDEPTLTATAVGATFTEGDASPADIFTTPIVASTVEAAQTFSSMTLTVTNVTDGASEILGFDGSSIALTNGTTPTTHGSVTVTVVAGTATVVLTGATLSASDLQTLVDGLSYSNSSQDPSGADRVVTITQLVDSGASASPNDNSATLSVTSTVHVTPVNDEPTLTATAIDPTYHENDAASALFSGAAASTVEAAQTIKSIKLTVSGLADAASERLSIDGADVQLTNGFNVASTHGTVAVTVAGTVATVTLSGMTISAADFQTLVNAIAYRDLDDTPTEASRTVTITEIVDSGLGVAPDDNTKALTIASTVGVVATDDAPVFANAGPAVSYTENGSSVLIDGNITVTDPELEASASKYAGATLTIQRHGGPNVDDSFAATGSLDLVDVNGNGENVSLNNGATFIGTYTNPGNGSLIFTFNANATAANIADVMQHIVYANASDNPPASLTVDFTLDDGNGQPGGQPQGSGTGVTTAGVVVNITQINDRPFLGNVATGSAYVFGSGGVVLSPSLVVADIDSTAPSPNVGVQNAVVQIADGYLPGDQLFVNLTTSGGFFIVDDGSGPIVSNISVQTNSLGRLVLSGTDTTLHYQQVLDAVSYRSTAADPTDHGFSNTRAISWQVNDGAPVVGTLLTAPGPTYATGASPFEGVTLDVNQDGILDLVVTTASGISVLLGSTLVAGTFGAKSDTVVAGSPRGIAAHDLNGDGNVDLAVASSVTGGVSVLLGDGAGGFTALPTVVTGTGTTGVAIADLNRDGKADLVVTNTLGNTVSVLLGDGTGTYSGPASVTTAGSQPAGIVVGDFNGDGKADVAVANQNSDNVGILLGDGSGGFAAATAFTTGAGTNPGAIGVADLNGDGFLDLVTANSNSNNVSVLLGNGSGGFGAPTTYGAGTVPHDIAIGDVDGDGFLDLVVANNNSGNVSVLRGNGNGTFAAAQSFTAGTTASAAMLGDFDRNGALDIAAANLGANNISVLLGNGTNNNAPVTTFLHFDQAPVVDLDASGAGTGFTTTFTENGAPRAIANTDATIDDPDNAALDKLTITLTNASAGDVLSLAGALPGGIDSSIDTSVAGKITVTLINSASFADYESALKLVQFSNTSDNPSTVDRDITVVGSEGTAADSNVAHATVHIIAVNDAPVATDQTVNGQQAHVITGTLPATDPDGPALTFSTVTQPSHGALTVAADGSYTYTPNPTYFGPDSFTFKANDGLVDSNVATLTFSLAQTAPQNVVWAGSTDLGSRPAAAHVAGVGDFNGNGTDDVLWYNPSTGQVDEWVMANGQWSASIGLGTHLGQVAGIGDFNGDGTDDVLWRDPNTGGVDLWIMKNGQWSSSVGLGSRDASWSVGAVGDFNGDGTDDIVWRNTSTGAVDEWVMKNGNWSSSVSLGARSLDTQIAGAGDFNHDGTDDILWHNATTGAVDEWRMDHSQWAGSIGLGARAPVVTQAGIVTHYDIAGIGDFNLDGTSDILWRNSQTGDVDAWVMFNGQWFSSSSIGPFDTHYDVAGIGNFNGAGGDDVLWHNPTSGQTGAWLLGPAGH